jgi:DNA-binding IclR family transcriptional regulator
MAEHSKTVDAALTLLAALRNDDGDATTTAELARRLGLSRTATARLLATLEAHDLARRTPAGWTLGQGVLGLARQVAVDQVVVSAPVLDDHGTPIASLSMIAPHHLTPNADVAAAVRAAARTISAELSANGGGHAPLPTGR